MALMESFAAAQADLNGWVENSFFAYTMLGNRIFDWFVALAVFFTTIFVFHVLKSRVLHHLHAMAERTETKIDDFLLVIVGRTGKFFFIVVAFFLATLTLKLAPRFGGAVSSGAVVALIIQGALWGNAAVGFWIGHLLAERGAQDGSQATTFQALGLLSRTVLWILTVLLILDNVGVNIGALVTGLGIGGVAVALAVQSVLGDLLASLSIVLDKPFVVGDFIVVDTHMGTVERIGLRTTRIKSISGEQIVFSNTDILKTRLKNFKRMQERRVLFTVSTVYSTSQEKIALIPRILRKVVEAQPRTRFDRAHFRELGASALVFEVVYYVLDPDYAIMMDIQQTINLEILSQFATHGIEFAYPTQTVLVSRTSGLVPAT